MASTKPLEVRTRANLRFRAERSGRLPYEAYAPIKDPRPDTKLEQPGLTVASKYNAAVVPFKAYGDISVWMFPTEDMRADFLRDYPSSSLTPPKGLPV